MFFSFKNFIMKLPVVSLFAALTIFSCQPKFNPEITVVDIQNTINYLASDSLKGRKPGDSGDLLTANYIQSKFKNAGLKLLYNDGLQQFGVITSVKLGEYNLLEIDNKRYTLKEDYQPFSFSANTTFENEVVFVGYGLTVNKDNIDWNDYNNVDVEGKWVIILNGDPEFDKSESVFVEYSDTRSKVLNATDHSVGGIIFVSGPAYNKTDELSPVFYDKNSSKYNVPVIQVKRAIIDSILKNTGTSVTELESELIKNMAPGSFPVNQKIKATTELIQNQVNTQNVAGLLPGNDPVFKNEYIVIGGHHDHLGMGGHGSGSRVPDTIAVHNGADDNASGVAAIIELAEKFAAQNNNKRSIIFTTFGAEEMGLVGSKAFVNEPPVDLNNVTAMFNFDMIGRLDSANNLSIGGSKTALETEALLNQYNTDFNLLLSESGYGPSDHSSFYVQNIPVFFISTGAHSDYHTPNDDTNLINFEGAQKVTSYAYNIILDVSNREKQLTFNEAGEKQRPAMGGRFKVTLGIMPDFAGMEKRGLRIDAVTKGKPAQKGGIQKGDIITAIDGKKVGNIYDYMNRLKTLEAGKTISVDVLRDEKQVVLLIQL